MKLHYFGLPIHTKLLQENVPLLKSSRIAEIGIGFGHYCLSIHNKINEYVGIDIGAVTIDMLKSRSNGIRNLHFVCNDICNIDFAEKHNGSFDIVISADTLQLIKED